jgi:hypothetical protein
VGFGLLLIAIRISYHLYLGWLPALSVVFVAVVSTWLYVRAGLLAPLLVVHAARDAIAPFIASIWEMVGLLLVVGVTAWALAILTEVKEASSSSGC